MLGLALALVYILTGRLGLLLALPPGYASGIFPPAGIALACAYLWGPRMLPYIALGALGLNLWISPGVLSMTGLIAACGIALASSLQAGLGSIALRRILGPGSELDTGSQVGRYLLASPVVCLVSSSLSVGILASLGVVPWNAFGRSWAMWLIGDTMGVIAMFPIVLALLARPRSRWRPRRLVIIPTLVVSLALVVTGYVRSSQVEQRRIHETFQLEATLAANTIESRLGEQGFVVDQLEALLASHPKPLSQVEFASAVAPVRLRYPHLQAIEWIPEVPESARPAFEAAQRTLWPEFAIRERESGGLLVPSRPRALHYPVLFVEPQAPNRSAVGYDLASHPARSEAIRRAMRTGRATTSAPVFLVQTDTTQASLLVLKRISQGGHAPGLVLVVLRVADFLAQTQPPHQRGMFRMSLLDPETGSLLLGGPPVGKPPLEMVRSFEFGDRRYALHIHPSESFLQGTRSLRLWGILVIGLLGTGLLGAVLLLTTGTSTRVEMLVEERTRDLAEATRRAEAAAKAKSQFLANMSHEIRTPMNAILGLGRLLDATRLDDHQRNLLGKLRTSGRTLLHLVDDILDLAKIEAGHLGIEKTEFVLQDVLDEVGAILSVQATEKSLDLRLERDDVLPQRLEGDPTRLRQVLLNLAGNALKFTERGSVTVRAEALDIRPDLARVRIRVRDTGIGMSAEQIGRLFLPFTQADESTTRRFGGTGLGLAISRRLVERMGGRIELESRPGEGSEFRIELDFPIPPQAVPSLPGSEPAEPSTSEAVPPASTGTIPSPPVLEPGPRLAGMRILVAEDNPVNQLIVEGILQMEGAQVHLANDGSQAVAWLAEHRDEVDAVLMDAQMPVLDGFGATRRIRSDLDLRSLPVIALSAGVLPSERAECFDAGMDAFLAKPIEPESLVATLLRLCKVPGGDSEPVR